MKRSPDKAPPAAESARHKEIPSRRTLLLLAGILVLSTILRVAYLGEVREAPDFAHPQVDAEFHDYWARGLAFGSWELKGNKADPNIRESPYFRPPGYPYFLATIYKVTGPGHLAPRIAQMLIGLINILLVFLLVRRWLGSTVALVAALWMGTYWIFIYYEGEFLETPLMIMTTLALANLLLLWTKRITMARAIGTGILLGISALVRPNALVFLPVVLAWAFWLSRRRPEARPLRPAAIGLVLGTVLAILPATVRNVAVSGETVLITSNAGINLYMGNNETVDGRCPGSLPGLGTFNTCYDYPGIVVNLEKRLGRKLNDSQVSDYFTKEALRFIRDNPGRFLELVAKKTLMFWGPLEISHNKVEEAERDNSPLLSRIPGGFSLAFALGLIGAAMLALDLRRPGRSPKETRAADARWEIGVLLAALVAIYFLSYLPFFMAARYRVPILPFLLAFGSYGIVAFVRMGRERRYAGLAVWAGTTVAIFLLANVNWTGYRVDVARWHYARGMGYQDSNRLDLAIPEWEQTLQLNPSHVSAHIDLGIAYALRGRPKEAHELLTQAVRLEPENAQARFNLGALYETTGRYAEGRDQYLEALRIDPNYRSAAEGLKRVTAAMRAQP